MWPQLIQLINPVGIVDSILDSRKHKRETKAAIQEQRLKNIHEGHIAEAEWNLTAIKNAGWKDEWLTLLLSVPLVGAFIPGWVPHINAGFQVLEAMPVWYQGAVAVAIAASFGYQKYAKTKFNNAYTLPKEE